MNGKQKQVTAKVRSPLLVLEDALVLCDFGPFHMKLVLTSLVSICASNMVSTTSSYLLPNAECDLNMSITQKGLLNAGPFIGFVTATFFTCFFVDAFGRKIFVVYGHAAMFIFTVLEASSQSYWSVLLMKILEGASLILCMVAMLALVLEFTHKQLRNRILMFIVSFRTLTITGGALLSWGLLPHPDWHFVIWKGHFELHAWNIYLYVSSIFSLVATLLYIIIPESPRYLLFQGKEIEALEILKSVYSENTGNDRDSFPIKTLGSLGILAANRMTLKTRVKKYLGILKQLFQKPLLYQMTLFSYLSFVSLLGLSTFMLWYPQLSTVVENYRKEHGATDKFCTMINHYTQNLNMEMQNLTATDVCVSTTSGPETYVNMIVVSLLTFFIINVTGYLVDYLGHKLLLFVLFLLCAVASGLLYYTSSSNQIALLVSVICGLLRAIVVLQKTAMSNLFPTLLRALGVSFILLWSRIGALLGNIIFPVLLQIDCSVPFVAFAVIIFCTSFLVYFIPSVENNTSGDK